MWADLCQWISRPVSATKLSQAQARQTGAQEEQAAGDGHVVTRRQAGIVAHEVVITALIGGGGDKKDLGHYFQGNSG